MASNTYRQPQPNTIEALDDAGLDSIRANFEALFRNSLQASSQFSEDLTNFLTNLATAGYIKTTAAGVVSVQPVAIPVTDGGTGFASYAIGDILYASTTTALAKLADVAVGSYLRSGGVATAPVWSTITIPNAAAVGDIWYSSATSVISALAKNTTATRYLSNTGISNIPAWAQIDLTNGVTGALPIANGGTNATAFTNTRVPFFDGTRLVDDADLTFATDTLTSTKLLAPTSVSTPSLISTTSLTATPLAGSNFNVVLSTTGDFAVNTNQFYVDTSAAKVSIGHTLPAALLHVGGNDGTVKSLFLEVADSTGGDFSADWQCRRARGTLAAKTAVQVNDQVGVMGWYAYDGAAYQAAAYISCDIDATPGASDSPGRLKFWTTPDGSATPAERMRIDSTGNVRIGPSAVAGASLDVVNAVTGANTIRVRNTTAGVGNYASLAIGQDEDPNLGNIFAYSSTYTTSTVNRPSSVLLRSSGSNGLALGTVGNVSTANITFWTTASGVTTERMRIDNDNGNLGIGATTFGTSAATVLGIFNGTEPSTSPADMIQLYSVDLSAGNATLGLRTETAVVTETVTSDRTLSIRINGTTYKVCLKS